MTKLIDECTHAIRVAKPTDAGCAMFPPPKCSAGRAAAEIAAHVGALTDPRLQPRVRINDSDFAAMSLYSRRLRFSPHSVLPHRLGTPCGIKDVSCFTLAPWSTRTHSVSPVAVPRYQTA